MLTLTRRIGEKLIIGDDIVVVIKAICGGQVKVSVEAPKTLSIHREEVYLRIKEQAGE